MQGLSLRWEDTMVSFVLMERHSLEWKSPPAAQQIELHITSRAVAYCRDLRMKPLEVGDAQFGCRD